MEFVDRNLLPNKASCYATHAPVPAVGDELDPEGPDEYGFDNRRDLHPRDGRARLCVAES